MKNWVNFHITSPHYYPIRSSAAFGAKRKLKALLKKISGGNSSDGGFQAKFKKNNSIVKIFQGFRVFLWSFCYCGATENAGDFLGILVQPQRFVGSVSCLFLYLSFIGLLLA